MLDPKHPLAELLRRDNRYDFDAYVFVFDALRYGQEELGLGAPPEDALADDSLSADGSDDSLASDSLASDGGTRESALSDEDSSDEEHHVTGPELCRAIQGYAIDQFGLLARNVLEHWGVKKTGDFGEIVFNLIDIGQMRKTDNDRREDFDDVYEFQDAFTSDGVFTSDSVPRDRPPRDDAPHKDD